MKNVGWIQLRIVRIFNRGPIRFNTTWDSYIIIFESMWEYSTIIASRDRLFVDYLKGIVPPKCKFLHHLLTLLLFQICRIYLFSAEHKLYYEECSLKKVFFVYTVEVKGVKCWYCWTSQTLIVWTKTVLQNIFCAPQRENEVTQVWNDMTLSKWGYN